MLTKSHHKKLNFVKNSAEIIRFVAVFAIKTINLIIQYLYFFESKTPIFKLL